MLSILVQSSVVTRITYRSCYFLLKTILILILVLVRQLTVDNVRFVWQWGLVCERRALVTVAQMALMVGVTTGNLAGGLLADRYA